MFAVHTEQTEFGAFLRMFRRRISSGVRASEERATLFRLR